jgi:hypothetical protein
MGMFSRAIKLNVARTSPFDIPPTIATYKMMGGPDVPNIPPRNPVFKCEGKVIIGVSHGHKHFMNQLVVLFGICVKWD